MSAAAYPHVFSPIKIGPVEIENRFYFPPHGNSLSSGGVPSNYFAHYYAERAAGGCGLLIQSLPVLPTKIGRQCPYYAETVPSFRAVADLIHENGAKIFGQLHYWWGSGGQWEPYSPAKPVLGASAYQRFDHYSVTHELSLKEIRHLISAYRQCARHLALAGYDGVEFHISHGILPEHFLSPYWNRRSDEYGGTLEGRMRFIIEGLQALREGAGPELAVGIRFNCDEMLPGGWTQDDAREILRELASRQLIDFADLDIAVEPNQFPLGMPNYFMPKQSNAGFVESVRDAVGSLPVLSALGRITSVAEAEQAIAAGVCDLVGSARGLIAEPELVKNAREGREEESRICIACNWCTTASKIGAFGCAINPASGRELRWGVKSFSSSGKSKVVVVGGGPGGLEAARVAAKNGHSVVLMERKERVGGQLNLLASLPGRGTFNDAVTWWSRQLHELGVDVRTRVDATPEMILAERPVAVVVATGATYANDGESGFISQAIPGAQGNRIYTPERILEKGEHPKGRVVVLDDEGLNTGVGIAELLAAEGADVEFVTRWMQPMENGVYTFEFVFIIPRLKQLGVKLSTQTYVKEISDNSVTLFDVFTNDERVVESVDAVVLSTMRRPQATLGKSLDGKVDQLFLIGDALAPRGFPDAIFEGHMFARYVGDENGPKDFADVYFARLHDDVNQKPARSLHDLASR